MKVKIALGLVAVIAFGVSGALAQEFTFTTTATNTVSSQSLIDRPGLTGNPLAIIVATPVGDTAKLNPHAIGAWYYSGKWNIFNTDHGGRHLVMIDKGLFDPSVPRDTIQLITVHWYWTEREPTKAEAIRQFKQNFDFAALKQMLRK